MDEFKTKTYMRVHHGEPCVITQVKQTEFKGKEFVKVTFESLNDGALIDLSLKLPFNEYDKKKVANIASLCGVKKLSEAIGKQLTVTVQRREWEGKSLFNPNGFAPIGYTLTEGNKDEEQGTNNQDDLGF